MIFHTLEILKLYQFEMVLQSFALLFHNTGPDGVWHEDPLYLPTSAKGNVSTAYLIRPLEVFAFNFKPCPILIEITRSHTAMLQKISKGVYDSIFNPPLGRH